MGVFTQYDIERLSNEHPQTVAALYQQAHRIERRRTRAIAVGTMYGSNPTHLDDLKGDYG